MIVNVPVPEIEGSNKFPLTPVPVKVPPTGVPLKVTAGSDVHAKFDAKINDTEGNGLTVTSEVIDDEQPFDVPVTVYVVFVLGVTEIVVVVAPLSQLYEEAPLADKVVESPEHIVELLTVITGLAFTKTFAIFVSEHPKVVPVTV